MSTDPTPFFARDDTFFGVCHALGEDFGFHPNWLRLALGVGLLASPTAVVAIYAGLAVIVGFSRLLAPNPRRPAAQPVAEAPALAPAADNETARRGPCCGCLTRSRALARSTSRELPIRSTAKSRSDKR